jgi:RNA polymerase sigma-70 factor, ECF subfamily
VDSRARFEALYRAHAGAVSAYARRRMDVATADDLVSDVFLVAWRRLDDVPADPLPWLLGIARRLAANTRRGNARRLALAQRLVGRTPAAVHEPSLPNDRDSDALQALRRLPERDREVLMLVAWDGLDRRQAAAVLGISVGTFAVRLHRARQRFANALAANDPCGEEAEVLP